MRGKRRPPEERLSNVAGPLPPCRVCGEQAAGFHYGVNTCEACKGFFRRSLLRNGDYECIGSDNCVIGTNRRKSCPKCRYQKCLEVGMSKEAIKTGRYTYMKRTQDTLEIKKLEECAGTCIEDPVSASTDSCVESQTSVNNAHVNLLSLFPSPPLDLSSTEKLHSFTTSVGNTPDMFSHNASNSKDPCSSPDNKKIKLVNEDKAPSEKFKLLSYLLYKKPEASTSSTDIQTPMKILTSSTDENSIPLELYQCLNSCLMSPESDTGLSNSNLSKPSQDLLTCKDNVAELSQNLPNTSPYLVKEEFSCFMSPSSSCSPGPASSSSTPRPTLSDEPLWLDYDQSELSELISLLVSGHKDLVQDCNSLSDDYFEQKFKECSERCKLKLEVFGHMGNIEKDEALNIYNSTGLDVDGRMDDLNHHANHMEQDIRQMITFMKLVPGFKSLCVSDQTALVKACIYELFTLAYYRGYNRQLRLVVEYNRSYCIHDLRRFHDDDFLEIIFNMTDNLQQLNLTYDVMVIMKAICIFFPDRVELEQRSAVERLHQKMVQCLLLLLQRDFPTNHGPMLANIISFFTSMRTVDKECRETMRRIGLTDYSPFQNRPILIELFCGSIS